MTRASATSARTAPVVVDVALADAGDGLQVRLSIDSGITSQAARLCPEDTVTLARSLLAHAERAGKPSMA